MVVLRCAVDTRVDIVAATSERAAIADTIARAFKSPTPPDLPLISTHAAPIPRATLAELADRVITAPTVPPRPVIHVVGILQIAKTYAAMVVQDRDRAREVISDFFGHHGVAVDFRVARPIEPAEQAFRGGPENAF